MELRARISNVPAAFIDLYRELSEDKNAFEEEKRQIPELTLNVTCCVPAKALKRA
jgi:hypothetical protein